MDMRKLLEAVTKFAGEPEQKPGEQWKGTDSAPPGKKLVGDSIIKDLAKGPTPKTKEQELAEAYAKFLEDNLGVEEKRPARKGSRHARGHEPQPRYKTISENTREEEWQGWKIRYQTKPQMQGQPLRWMTWHTKRGTESAHEGSANTPQEAIQAAKDWIQSGGNAKEITTSSVTIDFNVKFATDIVNGNDFYAMITKGPTLLISNDAKPGFKRSHIRTQKSKATESTTMLPMISLSNSEATSAGLKAHGRYILGDTQQMQDGTLAFPLIYQSTVQAKGDMMRLGKPGLTVAMNREFSGLEETDQGISQDSETKFHKKLDKLVHDTFGRRKEEMKEGWGRGNDRVTLPDDSTLYWSGNGPLQDEYDALYNELVPSQGKADTIEGEVLRAASKIVYRHYNDGDDFNQASFEQLVPYIGAVTSYDDLAHKSTEFAMKANGNYTPNPNWDSLDVMEYGPEEDDYDDEEDDDWDDEYEDPNEEDDEDLDEARTTWNSDWYVYNPETLAVKKKFRTYKGAKQYAEANGLKLAASEWYHDKINTQKQTDEGWESGPEERSSSRERDPDDAYDDMRQQKADAAAQAQQARRPQEQYYTLTGRGPNMEPNYAFPGEYATQDEAVAARARLMADPKTPNPRDISISKRTRYLDLKEGIESADPVEGAVLAAVQELIQQGHTEVAPEVITNMVVAATSQPFLLKDLVDANNNSPAVQHYIDSINPTKVKFSNEILTVKNEDPLKDKKSAQAGVANMAARAAGRNRLGEASTPLRDREDYDAKNKALQDIQVDPHTSKDPQLSAELARRKAELVQQAKQLGISESRAHKIIANKLKQMELRRQLGSPESDAAYAQHIDSVKKSKEEYLKKTPNTIYKREVDEAGSAIGGGAIGSTAKGGAVGGGAIGGTAKGGAIGQNVAAALNTFKSATGSNAPAPNIAKALDAVTQGEPVGGAEMKVLEPVMKDLATVATDPKLASQFKSLAGQVNQTQAKQQQQQ